MGEDEEEEEAIDGSSFSVSVLFLRGRRFITRFYKAEIRTGIQLTSRRIL